MPPDIPPEIPACIMQAAEDYSVPARALIALFMTEGGRIGSANRNTNGTYDYGPMQINTVWVNHFNKNFGITAEMLQNDFCFAMRAAAYILRYEINQAGGDFWQGIGHYHSRNPDYKARYIRVVYSNSQKF